MYSGRFVYQPPVALYRDVKVKVYCFNSVNSLTEIKAQATAAIEGLFAPRPGLLMTNFYEYDLTDVVRQACPNQVSYIEVEAPIAPMIVTTPESPIPIYTVTGAGTLEPLLYSYSIAVDVLSPAGDGTVDVGSPANWVFPQVTTPGSGVLLDWTAKANPLAVKYTVWGRKAGYIGKLAELNGNQTTFFDDGVFQPPVKPVNRLTDSPIRYNKLRSLTVEVEYANRQTKITLPVRDIIK
jgi:hypothetical protein